MRLRFIAWLLLCDSFVSDSVRDPCVEIHATKAMPKTKSWRCDVRLLAVLALMSTVSSWTASAQSNLDTESNTLCIERLRMPVYPRLADASRISGSLTSTVILGSTGSVQSIVLDTGGTSTTAKRLFSPAVEKALQLSAFSKTCSGKSVRLVFHFVLGEELDPNHLPQAISFGYPNQFWISVPAKVVQR
jgi:hypothetical protein